MSNKRLVDGESTLDLDDPDFFKNLENPQICELSEIDISKPGWELIVYFDAEDPKVDDSEAAKDFWLLEEGEALGLFHLKYLARPVREAILSYDENCGVDSFDAKLLALLSKYRLLAKAPKEARKSPVRDQLVERIETIINSTEDDAEFIDVSDDIDVVFPEEEEASKIADFKFEVLAIGFDSQSEDLGEIIDRLKAIAIDENLGFESEDDGSEHVQVYLYKRDDFEYILPMAVENLTFIEQFSLTLV